MIKIFKNKLQLFLFLFLFIPIGFSAAPVISVNTSIVANEATTVNLNASFYDADGDTINVGYAWVSPNGSYQGLTSINYRYMDYSSSGTWNVYVVANDGGVPVTATVYVRVNNVNRAPVISVNTSIVANEGTTVTLNASISDPDGDSVNVSYEWYAPTGQTYVVVSSLYMNYASSGRWSTYIYANDGSLNTTASIIITVNNVVVTVNSAPSVTVNPTAITVNEGAVITFSWVASDPDGNTPTITITGWLNTNNYTTTYTDSGLHYVSVNASDGLLSASRLLRIYVNNVNRAPVISVNTSIVANEGTTVTLNASISDPDGDTLNVTYSWWSPSYIYYSGATLNSKYMDYNSSGIWDAWVQADDGNLTTTVHINLIINDTNRAPSVTVNPTAITVNEGAVITFSWVASDPDGNTPTISISGWLNTNNYTTSYTDEGLHYVSVNASDGLLSATASLRIYVNNVNRAPSITLNRTAVTVNEGAVITFSWTASDPDGNTPTITITGWLNTNNYTTSYTDSGLHYVTVSASDGSLVATKSLRIYVNNVNRAPAISVNTSIIADEGTTVTLNASINDPDGDSVNVQYSWLSPTGDYSGFVSLNYRYMDYSSAGTWNAVVIADDGETLVFSSTINVIVNNVVVATPSYVATIVGTSFNYTTIQDALNAASAGQTIQVFAGTLTGNGNVGLVWPNINNLILQGVSSVDTILDGENANRHVLQSNAVRWQLKDLMLKRGKSPSITDTGDNRGGAIWMNSSSVLTMNNCIVSGNTAYLGGAFYEGNKNIMNSIIKGNSSTGFGGGFALGTNILTNSNVFGNSGTYGGGFAEGINTISNSNIYGNSAFNGGGFYNATNQIISSRVYLNSATTGGGFAYGINTLRNTIMDNNSASSVGSVFYAGDSKLINSTVVSNTNVIYWDAYSGIGQNYGNFTAYNTILVGNFNGGTDAYFNTCTVDYCTFTDSSLPAAMNISNPISGFSTLQFMDYSNYDYRVISSSVAVNTGSTALWNANSNNVTIDFAGNVRITGSAIDLGAYETSYVAQVNRAPVISVNTSVVANEGTTVYLNDYISDADGDTLNVWYSWMRYAPSVMYYSGATLNSQYMDYSSSGTWDLYIIANDGYINTTMNIKVTVNNVNRAPSITLNRTAVTVNEGAVITFSWTASDPDGNTPTITITGWLNTNNYTTSYTDSGLHYVTVSASDGSLVATKSLRIYVNNVNRAPVISVNTTISANEGDVVTISPNVSDADGDSLIVWYAWFTSTGNYFPTSTNSLYMDYKSSGIWNVIVNVYDGSIELSTNVRVTVNNINQAPIVTLYPSALTVNEGAVITFSWVASDPDGNTPTTSISGWLNTNNYTTSYTDSGLHYVTVSASDGLLTTTASLRIYVNNVNRAPSITLNRTAVTVNEGAVVTFSWVASDPDGNTPTITISGWINTNNYTTSYTDSGLHYVTVSASDGFLSTSSVLRVYVNNVNTIPVISVNTTISANEGTTVSLNEFISDEDGDALSTNYLWSLQGGGGVSGATLNSLYMDFNSSGIWNAAIFVYDGSTWVSTNVRVTVNNVNRAPSLTLNRTAVTVNEGAVITFSWVASDPDGNTPTISISGWLNTNNYTTSYTDSGLHYVTVSASDGLLNATASLRIYVNNLNRAPSITLNRTAVTVNEGAVITFSWTASDPDGNTPTITITGWLNTNNYTTSYTDSGLYYVTVSASDGSLVATKSLRIYVNNVNTIPVISVNTSIIANEGVVVTITPSVSDADGDSVNVLYEWVSPTWSSSGGQAFNSHYMDYFSSGTWRVYIMANDGTTIVTETVLVTVNNVNRTPILALNTYAITVNEGAVITFSWTAFDLDITTPTITITGWINTNNYTTSYTDSGLHYVTVSASDGSLVATKSLRIYVTDVIGVVAPSSSEEYVTSHIDVHSGVSINVNIPTNSISEPARLFIETTPTISYKASFVVTGDRLTGAIISSFSFLQAVEVSLNSLSQGRPVSINNGLVIEIGLSPNVYNTRDVRVYYFNPLSGKWENDGITMIAVYPNRAIFRTTHLTYFSVISLELVNQAPVITLNVYSITVYDTEVVSFNWVASDPDGDTINVSITGWLSTNNHTATYLDIGEHFITVSVSDGQITVDKQLSVVVLPLPIDITSIIVWPNPFNPKKESINFKFNLNETCIGKLNIYSINGKLIKSISVSGTIGPNTIVWDGKDNAENLLTSELYVYLLQVEGTTGTISTKTGKIVIWNQ